jgi:two-component system, NarL family, nitrate/nitrite response regulator NarL
MAAYRIFLVESQPVVIAGLQGILQSTPDFAIVGSAPTPAEAITQLADTQPDLVLIDQSSGIRAIFTFLSELKVVCPSARAVLWIMDLAEIECFRALQLGARGILRRSLPIATMLDCLQTVAKGNLWLENSISDQVVGFLNRKSTNRLTPREREIVRAVCRGMKNKEIADLLHITPGTVKVHLMHIFEKTGVKDRFELAVQGPKLLGLESEESISAS